ncbi:nucleotidyltransferase family protein [Pseudomonas sp. ISL-84]|nr:nucleotidyltransferase family protein [Pseudomonas sp. ISL-84]
MSMRWIQALYDPGIPLPDDPSFFKKALKDISYFGVSSQVYYLLKQQGKLSQTPVYFQERLKGKYNEALYLNLFIKSELGKILSGFESLKVEGIPLKGVIFAEKYFGHIGARGTSDIDLLIRPNQLEKAIECVSSLGFTVKEEPLQSHFHCSFSKEIPGSRIPLTVELHWDLLKENSSSLNINEFWDKATPLQNYRFIKELSDYHTFYMICLHGWRHNMDSLKYFLDIIQMIYYLNDRLDYRNLLNDACNHKTLKRMVRTLSIVYKENPYLQTVRNLPVKRFSLWDYSAFKSGNRRSLKNYLDFFDYQFLSFDTAKHSFKEFSEWVKVTNLKALIR